MKIDEHVRTAPSAQNALDIFEGEWAGMMPPESGLRAGSVARLYDDIRMHSTRQVFDGFDGKSILEIGPLEGGHTHALCRMGARLVTAVESNPRAYLKCLIIKEVFGLTAARFLLGDAVEYLRHCRESFDVCIASGILYHLRNPVEFLDLIAPRSDRLFLWTHYYDLDALERLGHEARRFRKRRVTLTARGEDFTGVQQSYAETGHPCFLGGTHDYSVWMPLPEIERVLRHLGFPDIRYGHQEPDHPLGPATGIWALR